MEVLIGVFVFIFGIVIGSFLNVCILRLPENRSIVTGPSSCPSCGARLTATDMVPVLSYLFLRGKCRHCGAKVSPLYPAVELLTGVMFLLLYLIYGFSVVLPVYMALLSLLIVLSFIDWRSMIIPNGLIIAMLSVGAAVTTISFFTDFFGSWTSYVIGFFAGGVPLLLIALTATYILKKDAMGAGDIKLMAAAGLVIGWRLIITSYLIGIITGAVFGVILIASGKKKRGDEMPFGPFLSLGIAASLFFGDWLIEWYLNLI